MHKAECLHINHTQTTKLKTPHCFPTDRTPVKTNMRSMLATFLNEVRIKDTYQLLRTCRLDQLILDLEEGKFLFKVITVSLFSKLSVSGQVYKIVAITHTTKKNHQVFEKFSFGFGYSGNLLYRCRDKFIDLVKKHLRFVLVCTEKQMLVSLPPTAKPFILSTFVC